MDSLLLKVEDVQKTANLGRSKVYELIASGELQSIRVGRAIRVPRQSLESWIEKQLQTVER